MQKPWLALAFAAFASIGFACNTATLKGPAGGASSGDPADPAGEDPASDVDGGSAPAVDADGGVLPMSSNVSIQVLPSDSGAAIEAAIRAATTSVHMTMYLLTSDKIIDALGDLHAAGKDVKVVLNQKFPPNGGSNTSAYNALVARNVPVHYAPSAYTFTHAKAIVIDSASLIVMTMNLTQSSAKDNREYIATDADPADVADAETLFAADYAGQLTTLGGNLVVSPQGAQPVDARLRLKALIESARTSLDVEVQSLSDDALTDAIVAAHEAKVKVRVVIASGNDETPAQADAIATLKQHGVPLVGLPNPYNHAKVIVVDEKRVFVGSQNFTPTALFYNREIGVVTEAAGEAAKVRDVIAKDFAAGVAP